MEGGLQILCSPRTRVFGMSGNLHSGLRCANKGSQAFAWPLTDEGSIEGTAATWQKNVQRQVHQSIPSYEIVSQLELGQEWEVKGGDAPIRGISARGPRATFLCHDDN